MKYRKKPIVVDALQWLGNLNQREIYNFLTNYTDTDNAHFPTEGENFRIDFCNGGCSTGDLYIKTLEGFVKADINDYIIKDENSEFYPCKPDIFEKTYENVNEKKEYDKDISQEDVKEILKNLSINTDDINEDGLKALTNYIKNPTEGLISNLNETVGLIKVIEEIKGNT
jgi:hypothetical protein